MDTIKNLPNNNASFDSLLVKLTSNTAFSEQFNPSINNDDQLYSCCSLNPEELKIIKLLVSSLSNSSFVLEPNSPKSSRESSMQLDSEVNCKDLPSSPCLSSLNVLNSYLCDKLTPIHNKTTAISLQMDYSNLNQEISSLLDSDLSDHYSNSLYDLSIRSFSSLLTDSTNPTDYDMQSIQQTSSTASTASTASSILSISTASTASSISSTTTPSSTPSTSISSISSISSTPKSSSTTTPSSTPSTPTPTPTPPAPSSPLSTDNETTKTSQSTSINNNSSILIKANHSLSPTCHTHKRQYQSVDSTSQSDSRNYTNTNLSSLNTQCNKKRCQYSIGSIDDPNDNSIIFHNRKQKNWQQPLDLNTNVPLKPSTILSSPITYSVFQMFTFEYYFIKTKGLWFIFNNYDHSILISGIKLFDSNNTIMKSKGKYLIKTPSCRKKPQHVMSNELKVKMLTTYTSLIHNYKFLIRDVAQIVFWFYYLEDFFEGYTYHECVTSVFNMYYNYRRKMYDSQKR